MNWPDDSDLVVRLRARDETALERLVASYQARVYTLALRLTGNRPDAEEVVQDVFLNVVRHVGSFRGDAKLSTWIYRITTNAALMKLRKRPPHQDLPLDDALGPAMSPEGMIAEQIVDWTRRPSQELERTELRERLAAAIDELPADYRAVVVLRDIEGVSADEACEVLNLSLPALKSRLHRARLFLRKRLARYVATSRPDQSTSDAKEW